MTDPGERAPLVSDLPSSVGGLINVVQGLLIHVDWLDAYPVDKGRLAARDAPHRRPTGNDSRKERPSAARGASTS
jgi:hypothetical protein